MEPKGGVKTRTIFPDRATITHAPVIAFQPTCCVMRYLVTPTTGHNVV